MLELRILREGNKAQSNFTTPVFRIAGFGLGYAWKNPTGNIPGEKERSRGAD